MKNKTIKYFVGVDVSKDKLDIYYHPQNRYEQIANEVKAVEAFLAGLKKIGSPVRITCEATGGYQNTLVKAAHAQGLLIGTANARRVRDFAKAMGLLAKTDKIDAKTIALFEAQIGTHDTQPLTQAQEALAAYRKRREQLIDMITMEKNRLPRADRVVARGIKKHIKLLEDELKALEKASGTLIKQDEELLEKSNRLQTCKGVGKVVSFTLLANLKELGMFNRREIASLVGVAPHNQDSGYRQGKRKTWGGRSSVRCALYMAALVAAKHNPLIKALYERFIATGKAKKVALVACMRKLLLTLNNMLKNKMDWSANYNAKNEALA